MRAPRIILIVASISVLLAASPAHAQLEVLWQVDGETLAVGEFDRLTGLEALVLRPDQSLWVVEWTTGLELIEIRSIPPWLQLDLRPQLHLVDFNGDGMAEMLVVQRDNIRQTDDHMGLLRIYNDDLEEIWSLPGIVDAIEFAPILAPAKASGQLALLCQLPTTRGTTNLKILDLRDGVELFDFYSQPGLDALATVYEVEVLDVILGGSPEVLVHYSVPPQHHLPGEYHSMLIGLNTGTPAPPSPPRSSIFLAPSRPNPTTHSSVIQFRVPEAGGVKLRIYSPAGRLVRELLNGPMLAGRHEIMWDGRDDLGVSVSSGVYFYELQADDQRRTRKLVRLR